MTFGDDTLTIVEATVPANEVDPGSTVDVRLRLRRYDDMGKIPGMATPDLEHCRSHMMAGLRA